MYWYGNGMGGWGYGFMAISMILVLGLIIAGIVLLFRLAGRGGSSVTAHPAGGPPTAGPPVAGPPGPGWPADPERLLAERFARGELDEDEYRRRLAVLREGGQAARATP